MLIVQETRTQGRESNWTSTAPMWLQVKLHWTLKHSRKRSFFGGRTSSYFVPQLIYEFSFWIHHFVISALMCKFMTRVGLSLQWFQTEALRPIQGMDTGIQWIPSPGLKSIRLRKEGDKKQTSWTSTKLTSDWISTAQDNKYKVWHIS